VIALGLGFLASPWGAGYDFLIVQSGSMEPELAIGSLVLIGSSERYAVGDVITFRASVRDELPTTHRIIEENLMAGTLSYTTKGDANASADQVPVTGEQIIGRVLFGIPFLGYLLDFARQPLGFVLLVVLPAGLIVFDELSSLWAAWRRRQKGLTAKSSSTV
jgi:signal peptidase